MAVVKHLIPKRVRSNMVASIDQRFPDGPIRNNIGNAITVGGAILVAAGAKVDGKLGWGLRAVGQIADDVDGDATRALNTSSKFGAKLDAIMDKIKMALELGLLWKHTSELEGFEKAKRRAALGFIGLKHLTNAGLNIAATIKGIDAESSTIGRINLWADGLAVESFGLAAVIENPDTSENISDIGYDAVLLGIPIGIATAVGYVRQLRPTENSIQ